MRALPPRDCFRLLVLVALAFAIFFLPGRALTFVIVALSPLVFMSTLWTAGAFLYSLVCAAPVLFLVLWRRRAFCHYGCPMGFLLERCAGIRPGPPPSYARVFPFGYWAALLTLGGALVACPLFLFLDPIAILSSGIGGIRPPFSAPQIIYLAGLILLIGLNLVFPALWCRRLCPLGGLQEALSDLVLSVKKPAGRSASPRSPVRVARRVFLGMGFGAALAAWGRNTPGGEPGAIPFRPPGAAEEPLLKTLCIRCNSCVRTCPSKMIYPDTSFNDPAGWLTPVLRFDTGFCLDNCNRCGQHCPTGAIAPLSLEEKNNAPIALASVDQGACLLAMETECVACIAMCKRLALDGLFSEESYSMAIRVDAAKCNGCGACLNVCPAEAITLIRHPKTGTSTPLAGVQRRLL
jgi:formate hydrogenlyase subunit 6/NADH:ubiquinone oxidoreductase subunit I